MSSLDLFFTPIVYDTANKSWQDTAVEFSDDLFYFGGRRIHVKGTKARLVDESISLSETVIKGLFMATGLLPAAALAVKFALNPRDALTGLYSDTTKNKVTAPVQKKIRQTLSERDRSAVPKPRCVGIKQESQKDACDALLAHVKTLTGKARNETFVESSCKNSYITYDTIARFAEGEWLSDECINTFFEDMVMKSSDCLIASSYFKSISKPYKMFWTADGGRPVSLFTENKPLFIPIHIGGVHWALLQVDLEAKKMHYYDSLSWKPGVEVEQVKELLKAHALLEGISVAFEVVPESCPQQTNGSDCGVFTCMAASRLMQGKPLDYSAKDVPAMRRQMLTDLILQERKEKSL